MQGLRGVVRGVVQSEKQIEHFEASLVAYIPPLGLISIPDELAKVVLFMASYENNIL
jgi:hypothetical protein